MRSGKRRVLVGRIQAQRMVPRSASARQPREAAALANCLSAVIKSASCLSARARKLASYTLCERAIACSSAAPVSTAQKRTQAGRDRESAARHRHCTPVGWRAPMRGAMDRRPDKASAEQRYQVQKNGVGSVLMRSVLMGSVLMRSSLQRLRSA